MKQLLLLFLFFSISVSAQSWKTMPVQFLTEIQSSPVSEVTFAKQVGEYLSRYSSRTGYEACAGICRSHNGNWIAQVGTIGSHTSCKVESICPSGYQMINKTIHSHPTERSFEANTADFQVWGKPYQANYWATTGDPRLFSDSDYLRPGYLVVYGQLYFQSGPDHIIELGSLRP